MYSSIVYSENPNQEFDMSNVPIMIPHCTYFVTVNCAPKNIKELIHFGIETVQYNSVNSNSEFDKMMIEATNIDYLKTLTISISISERSYSTTVDTPSIIDIIDNIIPYTFS
ncbi:586_t:CDS:2 [Gigaspora margarita]|uniref:586_t:CDS:1 n=1 Tax=Gigaspora margarita TaxID=4874 RepID=A0ABN7W238_GIGMA|nr:586_t:CDS:2 [Gigaspora margarita]